jgi:hypothetical protein
MESHAVLRIGGGRDEDESSEDVRRDH